MLIVIRFRGLDPIYTVTRKKNDPTIKTFQIIYKWNSPLIPLSVYLMIDTCSTPDYPVHCYCQEVFVTLEIGPSSLLDCMEGSL